MTDQEKIKVQQIGNALMWTSAALSSLLLAEGKISPPKNSMSEPATEKDKAEVWQNAITIRQQAVNLFLSPEINEFLTDAGMDLGHDPCI